MGVGGLGASRGVQASQAFGVLGCMVFCYVNVGEGGAGNDLDNGGCNDRCEGGLM